MNRDEPGPRRSRLASGLSALLHWAPVAIALGLFAQLALLGLKPALAERERLEAAERRLGDRLQTDEDENERLSALRTALEDPIYRERLRLERLRLGDERRDPTPDGAQVGAE